MVLKASLIFHQDPTQDIEEIRWQEKDHSFHNLKYHWKNLTF